MHPSNRTGACVHAYVHVRTQDHRRACKHAHIQARVPAYSAKPATSRLLSCRQKVMRTRQLWPAGDSQLSVKRLRTSVCRTVSQSVKSPTIIRTSVSDTRVKLLPSRVNNKNCPRSDTTGAASSTNRHPLITAGHHG